MSDHIGDSSIRHWLKDENFPPELLDAWEAEGIRTLLPIQVKALTQGILNGKSCLVIGPTSCGKTFVGELLLAKHALAMRRCLYLVPFKALAEEKWVEFTRKYARPEIGARVVISTADRRDGDRALSDGDFDLAILTYEKLSTLLVQHPSILTGTGALIVDEIQMVSDESRGAELELLLTRIRQVAPHLQIIGLSAVVSELNGFDKWLPAAVNKDDHRPVKLREGAIIPTGKFDYVEWDGSERAPSSEVLYPLSGADEDQLTISLMTQMLRNESEQVLVFVNSVDRTQQLAQAIASKTTWLPAAVTAKRTIASLEETTSVDALSRTLDRSVAFHNADLTLDERLAVEGAFRACEVRCVVATSTLSMGVNLPASAVVILDYEKWTKDAVGHWQQMPISVNEYRNMSGRAGRFGLRADEFGRSILISKSPLQQRGLITTYVNGEIDPLESAFLKQPLDVRVLRIVASKLCNTADGLLRFLLKTFAGTQKWTDATSQAGLAQELEQILSFLVDSKLIDIDGNGKITPTQLGLICASSGLRIETFGHLVQFVQSGNMSPVDITLLASKSHDTGPDAVNLNLSTAEHKSRFPYFSQELSEIIQSIPSPESETHLNVLASASWPSYETMKALKFQLIAMAYISGIGVGKIENQLNVRAGRAKTIGANCSWLCDSAAAIAWALRHVDQAKPLERISDRFLHGCSEEALFLAQVPHHLHREEREALVKAAYTTFQKIIDTPAEEIAKTARISRGRVQTLQQGIIDVLGESLELERQQLRRLEACGLTIGPLEALYTAKGTMLEQAIEDILQPPFCPLTIRRITSQREGEADLHIILSNGKNGIGAVGAKDRPTDRIALVKAGSVLQQSPELNPEVFICFGRPDFDQLAINKADAHVSSGRNYKIIPISVIAEMYVRFHEGRLLSDRVQEILEQETGYITLNRL